MDVVRSTAQLLERRNRVRVAEVGGRVVYGDAERVQPIGSVDEPCLEPLVHGPHVAVRARDVAFAVCDPPRSPRVQVETHLLCQLLELRRCFGHLQVTQVLTQRARLVDLNDLGLPGYAAGASAPSSMWATFSRDRVNRAIGNPCR